MIMQRLFCFALVMVGCLTPGFIGAQQVDVPALVEQLSSADPSEARSALDQLRELGEKSVPAIPALIDLLKSPDSRVAVYAATTLESIGPPAAPAAEALLETVFNDSPAVRRAAIEALQAIGPDPEKMESMLERILLEGNPTVIVPALETFAEFGEAAVPRVRALLRRPDLAYWGVVLAGDIGPAAADAVPELIPLLDSPQHELRIKVLIALGEIGPNSAAAVPAIVQRLESDEIVGARYAAAFALGNIGAKTEEANRALVDAARGEEPTLKMLSLWALARINPDQQRVVKYAAETLVAGLAIDDAQVRSVAARALADFGDHAELVAPALVAMLQDADPQVVGNALDALASIGPEVVDRIAGALKNPDLRHYATRLLYRLGPEAAEAVPALTQALQEPVTDANDAAFRVETQMALAAIGPAAAPAVQELIKSLDSDDIDIRGTACYALGKIGAEASNAVGPLRNCLQHLDPTESGPVWWALLQIRPDDREIIQAIAPRLIAALEQPSALVRAEAAAALGNLGEDALPALPRLKQLQEDPDPAVQEAAGQAVRKLEAGSDS
jgi:HEAT repeat protein